MLKSRHFSILTLCLALIQACSTKVETGRNGQVPNDSSKDGTGIAGEEPRAGTCFGVAEKLPEEIQTFCDEATDADYENFARILDDVCVKKKLVNLLRPECGWDGKDKIGKYVRILEHSHHDKPADDETYYYYVAYSMTFPKSNRTYSENLLLAHSDPEEFKKRFVMPKGTELFPSNEGVVIKDDRKTINYSAKVTTQAGGTVKITRYDSLFETFHNNKTISFVLDHTIGQNMEGMNFRRNVSISKRLEDGRGKIVVIEQRESTGIGSAVREIAKQLMLNVDIERMKNTYENSKRP